MNDLNGVPLRKNLVPKSKWDIKCPFPMVAKKVTYHNTDNEVSAWNEIAYMVRNTLFVSYHLATDETETVQGLEFDRNGWHSGDGRNGYGNRNTIGWEICRNYDRTRRTTNLIDPLRFMYTQAELNAIKASPAVFDQLGIVADRNTVKKHQDWNGKNCPSKILNERRWSAFQVAVIHEYNQYKKRGQVSSEVHTVKAGDTLSAIARAYEIQLDRLVEYNGIQNPNVLSIGQQVTIPLDGKDVEPQPLPKKSVEEVAAEIVAGAGNWSTGAERRRRLREKGYDPTVVQARVNAMIEERDRPRPTKTVEDVALEIITGTYDWSTGAERQRRLRAAGHDSAAVQSRVNELMRQMTVRRKSNEEVAREIVFGPNKWGNNPERSRRLRAEGYDPAVIQRLVNRLL